MGAVIRRVETTRGSGLPSLSMTDIYNGFIVIFKSGTSNLKKKKMNNQNSLLLRNSTAEVSRLLKGSIAAAKDFFGRLNWTILG